jgi:hypothetical protein
MNGTGTFTQLSHILKAERTVNLFKRWQGSFGRKNGNQEKKAIFKIGRLRPIKMYAFMVMRTSNRVPSIAFFKLYAFLESSSWARLMLRRETQNALKLTYRNFENFGLELLLENKHSRVRGYHMH